MIQLIFSVGLVAWIVCINCMLWMLMGWIRSIYFLFFNFGVNCFDIKKFWLRRSVNLFEFLLAVRINLMIRLTVRMFLLVINLFLAGRNILYIVWECGILKPFFEIFFMKKIIILSFMKPGSVETNNAFSYDSYKFIIFKF